MLGSLVFSSLRFDGPKSGLPSLDHGSATDKSGTNLVVANITFIFHFIWDVILPIDELHHFQDG